MCLPRTDTGFFFLQSGLKTFNYLLKGTTQNILLNRFCGLVYTGAMIIVCATWFLANNENARACGM